MPRHSSTPDQARATGAGARSRTQGRAQGRKHPRKTQATRGKRPPGRAAYRRALRREAPTVVGLLLDQQDFDAMTRYPSFPFHDYGLYLHHLDGLLRSLHAQGTSIAVTPFHPDGFASHCAATAERPDTPRARIRYTAEAGAAGPTLHYARQPLALLRARLAHETDRRATFDQAADLLAAAGPCPEAGCDKPFAHCAFDGAAHTLMHLAEAAGPGAHHIVCSVPTDTGGGNLLASAHLTAAPDGEVRVPDSDGIMLCTVMAAAALAPRPGGLVLRTTDDTGRDTVRGWSLLPDGPHPLSEAEVFDAYCTDPDTGQPVPPESGVHYRAGFPLPPPPPADGGPGHR
jgi:hypothetical protein